MLPSYGMKGGTSLISNICTSLFFQVLRISKHLLLQTAAPEAIVRLKRTPLADERELIKKIYFEDQHHNSIKDFLTYHVHQRDSQSGLLMQVCRCSLLSVRIKKFLKKLLNSIIVAITSKKGSIKYKKMEGTVLQGSPQVKLIRAVLEYHIKGF